VTNALELRQNGHLAPGHGPATVRDFGECRGCRSRFPVGRDHLHGRSSTSSSGRHDLRHADSPFAPDLARLTDATVGCELVGRAARARHGNCDWSHSDRRPSIAPWQTALRGWESAGAWWIAAARCSPAGVL